MQIVGHAIDPEGHRRLEPSMARNDDTIAIDEDRIGPAEGADRGCNLTELFLRMRARVAGIWLQNRDRHGQDLEITDTHRLGPSLSPSQPLRSDQQGSPATAGANAPFANAQEREGRVLGRLMVVPKLVEVRRLGTPVHDAEARARLENGNRLVPPQRLAPVEPSIVFVALR